MADRAGYLAKVFITRLSELEMGFLDDAGPDRAYERDVRRDMVAKVLATEVGLTDEISILRVLDALPRVIADEAPAQRDYDELAEFLRKQLSAV